MEYSWYKTKKLLQDEALKIITESKKKMNICDIGCGNGALLIRLAEATRNSHFQINYKGLEISKPFVMYGLQAAKFKKLSNISFNYFDIEKDELSEKFDVIICSEVLEHLYDPKNVLQKIYKSLNKGGVFLISTPNSKNLIKYPFIFLKKIVSRKNSQELTRFLTKKEYQFKLAELEQHLYIFSHGELKNLLKSLGFTIYKMPRSTTLFGGPFLDKRLSLLGLLMIGDSFLDIISLPQVGWDNIFFVRKDENKE